MGFFKNIFIKKEKKKAAFRTENVKKPFDERVNQDNFNKGNADGAFRKDPEERAMDMQVEQAEREFNQKAKMYGQ